MELLTHQALSVAAGLTLQLLAWLAPLRTQSGEKETRWDLTAMLCGVGFAHIYTFLVAVPLSGLLVSLAPVQQWQAWVGTGPLWQTWILYLVLGDFLAYWAHRWLHGRLFWHSHAWHHSPKHIWWLSGLRASPLHVVLLMLPYTVSYLVFPLDATGLALFGVILFGIANQHWLHSNIRVPFPRQLEWLVVTPRYHFVHHSADKRFTNSNYGFIFTVWDRLFGSHTPPERVAPDERLGLDYDNSNVRFLLGLPPATVTDRGTAPSSEGRERPQAKEEGAAPALPD